MSLAAHKDLARAYWQACTSGAEIEEIWNALFRSAFPDFERHYHILMAGKSSGRADGSPDDRDWVRATGYLVGKARHEVFGIPATDAPLRLRWSEFTRIEDGKIVEIQILIDMMDWFEQIGRSVLPPSLGVPSVWPAPTAFDGVGIGQTDPDETSKTLKLGRDLLFSGLDTFDESDLSSMGIARYFHPNIKWYGPGGIGACLSLDEFETRHQGLWLYAFTDRKVQDIASLFVEGRLLGASGPAGVKGKHSGKPFRDSGPDQGQPIDFCGLDFWLYTGDVFIENRVSVDFIHLFDHMGIDPMGRMKSQ